MLTSYLWQRLCHTMSSNLIIVNEQQYQLPAFFLLITEQFIIIFSDANYTKGNMNSLLSLCPLSKNRDTVSPGKNGFCDHDNSTKLWAGNGYQDIILKSLATHN